MAAFIAELAKGRAVVPDVKLGWIPADEADPSIPADLHGARTLLAKIGG